MSSAIADFRVYQGETLDSSAKSWCWKIGGVPVDLTGYTVELEVRRSGATALTLAKWTNTNGKLTLGGSSGIIAPNLAATETALLWEPGLVKVDTDGYLLGSYSLEVTSPIGRVQRLAVGRFIVVPKVLAV